MQKKKPKPLGVEQANPPAFDVSSKPLNTDVIGKIEAALKKGKKKKKKVHDEWWTCANRPEFGGQGCSCSSFALPTRAARKDKKDHFERPIRCTKAGKPLT